uniref:Predicted protein n=1 Tax=Hordeum vulgare subsp. vulgare TaxID=112509 RepID=F2CZD3_HORVV|nr:predicted protein [Hordeum vulgare subsp. vulgare]
MHPVAWLKMMMGTRRVMSAEGVFGSVLLCKTYVISEGFITYQLMVFCCFL